MQLPVSTISVESSGEKIDQAIEAGLAKMVLLKKILDRISAIGCIECWVMGMPSKDPLPHKHSQKMGLSLASLQSIKHVEHIFWPFCYRCWVPFRYPCNHPAIPRGRVLDTQCPYPEFPSTIPHLILAIHTYVNGQSLEDIEKFSSAVQLPDKWKYPYLFYPWLSVRCEKPGEIPNPFKFILAFYNVFR
jgi:hypothetical protein